MANSTTTLLRLAGETAEKTFDLSPDAEKRASLADALGIRAVRKLRFSGDVVPDGATDWYLDGTLGATVVQSCVVTLEPVTTRLDVAVERRFVQNMPDVEDASEVEMPDDDSLEPLTDAVDLERIMSEALALALPDFPRADGIAPVEISVTEPGKAAMTDDDAKPFAGLAALKESMGDKDKSGG